MDEKIYIVTERFKNIPSEPVETFRTAFYSRVGAEKYVKSVILGLKGPQENYKIEYDMLRRPLWEKSSDGVTYITIWHKEDAGSVTKWMMKIIVSEVPFYY